MNAAKKSAKSAGQVRLIGGAWRGRKLPVPDLPGLRPTGDRSRETLFNWLQPYVPGARCADLFAGSGALGFEAASRGAAQVHLVEIAPLAISALLDSRSLLGAEQVTVHRSNALNWLREQPAASLDLVFVDPPFDSGLAVQTINTIQQTACVAPAGFVYLETAAQLPELVMQAPFELWREKVLGEVRMRLFRHRDS
jgi:16S rRNA (guanine966-N2)-methyltransferase